MPDLDCISAFLDDAHRRVYDRVVAFRRDVLDTLPPCETDGEGREQARELVVAMGEAGLFDVLAASDWRGCALTRECLASASPLADDLFAIQALGTLPMQLSGAVSERQREAVAEARAGRAIAAFAMTEPSAGSDVAAMATRARRDGDEFVLDGVKCLISNAGIADFYTTFAVTAPDRGSRGISCFLVPAETPGLRFVEAQETSEPHPLGVMRFDGCRVGADALIGELHRGFMLGMTTLDGMRPTVAAAACGMAERALEESLRHVSERRQFGRALAEFQLVQQRLATMAIELSAARLMTYRAAWEKDRGKERITMEAAMAKAFATEAAQRIVDSAVQLHGGAGVLRHSVVDRLYRAVRALRIYEGATDLQHLIVARQLLADRSTG